MIRPLEEAAGVPGKRLEEIMLLPEALRKTRCNHSHSSKNKAGAEAVAVPVGPKSEATVIHFPGFKEVSGAPPPCNIPP